MTDWRDIVYPEDIDLENAKNASDAINNMARVKKDVREKYERYKERDDEWQMRFIDGKPRSHDPFKDIKLPKRSLFNEKRAIALKAYENNQ